MENSLDYLRKKRKKTRRNTQSATQSKNIFYTYEDSKDIATKMMKSFVGFYDKGAKGFPLDSINNKRIGIISNCMALSTFIELQNMDADTREYNDIFRTLIEQVFKDVYPNGEQPIFTAAPYTNDANITTYLETVSKVLITMVDLRADFIKKIYNKKLNLEKLDLLEMYGAPILIKGQEYSDFESILQPLEQLIIDCISLINESCLPVEVDKICDYKILGNKKVESYFKKEDKIRYKGWSFHKPETENAKGYEPSIYFTYHVTNAFLNFYKSFDLLMYLEYDPEASDLENSEQTPRESLLKNRTEEEKEKFTRDEAFFNIHKEAINEFRNKVISAGRYLDDLLTKNEVDLGYDFVNSDLTPISVTQLNNSSYSSVLLDTTFLLAILINAGIDDDYKQVDELDYLYNQFLYSLNNIKKVYDAKLRKSFEDSVATYKFGEEKMPSIAAEKFKNIRMATSTTSVYDLIPLYCNTYSTMFDFLIQYPQKEMVSNLKWVLDNKADGNNNWYWSKRGFNINNNLYYVFAIENFYNYYEVYERDFAQEEEEIRQKYGNEITSRENRISNLNKALEQAKNKADRVIADKEIEFNSRISELEKERDEKKSPLDLAVEDKIQNKIDSVIETKINDAMELYFSNILEAASKLKEIDNIQGLAGFDKVDQMNDIIKHGSMGLHAVLAFSLFDKISITPDTISGVNVEQVPDEVRKRLINKINTLGMHLKTNNKEVKQ